MKKLICTLVLLASLAGLAAAETVELLDGTRMLGEMIHYYDGRVVLKTADGEVVIEKSKIKNIVFKLPEPQERFSTPERTFQAWLALVKAGKLRESVECYALMVQTVFARQLQSMSEADRTRMIEETDRTEFKVLDVKIEGDRATLNVERKLGERSENAGLRFVKENNEWKMTP